MTLAIFDLDHTLIDGDSDYLWGEYMVASGLVDEQAYRARNEAFYRDYQRGELDNDQYLDFALEPLTRHPLDELYAHRRNYVETWIRPLVRTGVARLLAEHRARDHQLMIISATHRFITEPIAGMLGIPLLLATEPEISNGSYTGRYIGIATYREGKVDALRAWLDQTGGDLAGSYFYSDSINDLPLLEIVDYPHAVHPDDELGRIATARGWPVLALD
ncbi:MAG: HAD family hydrolase [Gammaproteobacteria bacterium]|nr:HAD family hydrolase [Gammaproteobacteria bacterium]